MAWKSTYAAALAAAFAAFAMSGGIRAAEKVAVAVERQEQAAVAHGRHAMPVSRHQSVAATAKD